jgi:hypothetical protein
VAITFYVINLAQPGTISLSLTQTLSPTLIQTSPEERAAMNATMRLLSDSREQLGSSQSSINQNVSKAGRYYVEVYAGFFIDKAGNRRFGQSNYNLQYRISS